MDETLRALLDRQQIVDLLNRYGTALDDRDWERLRSCFTPDAVGDYDPGRAPFEGFDAICTLCRTMLEPLDASQHLIASHEIEVSGDTARSRCYVRAQHVKRGLPAGSLYEVGGSYVDELDRTSAGWRIRKRQMIVSWSEGNPEVLRPPKN